MPETFRLPQRTERLECSEAFRINSIPHKDHVLIDRAPDPVQVCVCAVTLCVFEHVVRIIIFFKKKVEVYPFKDTTQSGMTQLYTPFSSTRKRRIQTPRGNGSEANYFLNSEKTNKVVWKETGYSTDHFYSTTNQIYLKNLNIFSDFILELSLFGLHCSKGY